MDHQIIPFGKDIVSSYLGIKEFGPDAIHLILTDETEEVYAELLPMLPKSIKVYTYHVEPYDGKQIEEAYDNIHNSFQGEFAYNISEGTKIMAFAANNVATRRGASQFYITQEKEIVFLPSYEKHKLRSTMDNMEFVSLLGNYVDSYKSLEDLQCKDVVTSYQIKIFIEQYYHDFERIHKFFRTSAKGVCENLPLSFSLPGNVVVVVSDGKMKIVKNDKTLLESDNPSCANLFFNGRWWETIVANKVKAWCAAKNSDAEVWQSVVFQFEEDPQVKNEVDIMINDKSRLLLVECKSGFISQNNIYKIDSVRETYGGDNSKAILVSYYPLDYDLQDKCEDQHIYYFAPPSFEARIHHINGLGAWLNTVLTETEI